MDPPTQNIIATRSDKKHRELPNRGLKVYVCVRCREEIFKLKHRELPNRGLKGNKPSMKMITYNMGNIENSPIGG